VRHPGVKVEVTFGNSQQSFERLLAHEADIGIIADVPGDPRIVTLPYSTHEVVAFVNADHPFYARQSLSIGDLGGQPVVHREQGSTTRNAVEAALRARGLEVDTVLELGSREGAWKVVEQGLGLGFVADFEFVPQPNLRMISFRDIRIRTSYSIAFHADRTGSRLVRAFCDSVLTKAPSV
jgi:DNA-binding transcriptional LysR family regulator